MIKKIGNSPVEIDREANRVTLKDTRFYLTKSGRYVPSVTTILDSCYPKGPQFYEWLKAKGMDSDSLRDEAGRKGSNVHMFAEAYDNGEEVSLLDVAGSLNVSISEWNMFEKYVEFCTRENVIIHANEQNFVSDVLGIGGTMDRLITMRGKRYLMDIKTGSSVWPHFWCQLASYAMMAGEVGIEYDGMCILHLNAKTRTYGKKDDIQGPGWQIVFPDEDPTVYWNRFKAVKTLWDAEFGDMKPRESSYAITYKRPV